MRICTVSPRWLRVSLRTRIMPRSGRERDGFTSSISLTTLRVSPGRSKVIPYQPDDRPVGPSSKAAAGEEVTTSGPRLGELQESLYAEGVTGGKRSVLVVLQGMDTSGKGGTIKHVCSHVNPQGLHIASFKRPTKTEQRHHFLWRIRRALPEPGFIPSKRSLRTRLEHWISGHPRLAG